jgi:asparagine synthase (glutamine-hydrolysing)
MCGITGYLHFDKQRNASLESVKKMSDTISHRGPDGEGFYIQNNIALGHRRLSIIDLSTGDQPMKSVNSDLVIVFNGEIYNYIELREELKQFGYSFKTNSDTEVILAAYDKWGYQCQNKFNGMWAFAIWNQSKQELFLSRDRIGEKPLHYTILDGTFIFGSEIKSLFAYGVNKIIRTELIELYLSLTNIPAPNTFYKDIYKLMPGHYLIVKDGHLTEKCYWDLPDIDENNLLRNKKEIYEQFEYLFTDSVKIRMRSDVPFGAFLSGGLDSSSIVAVMSEISYYPVKTFTIGFPEKEFDESKLAFEVALKFSTEHFVGTAFPGQFSEYLNRIAKHYDEPFGDSSAIPTDIVSGFASKKVKMVLTGDGGDEVLSGYTSYQGVKLSNIIRKMPRIIQNGFPLVNDFVAQNFHGNFRYKLNKASNIFRTAGITFNNRMAHKILPTSYSNIKELTKGLKSQITVEEYYNQLMSNCKYKDDFYKLMYLNFKHDLPNDYLVKVDRMSMANSLETRVPFLDFRLIEFMASVHKDIKMQGFERKSVLRNTIGQKLPLNLLKAKKKGFGIPLREWFKTGSMQEEIINSTRKISTLLTESTINEIINENKLGKTDNGNFIWTMMQLDKFL